MTSLTFTFILPTNVEESFFFFKWTRLRQGKVSTTTLHQAGDKKKTESISIQHCCSEMRHVKKHFLRAMVGQDPSYAPFEIHTCRNVPREDQIDPKIDTECFLWRSNHHDLHRGCGHAVNSFVMRSTILWNMFVPPESTTLAYKFSRMSASHFGEVSWIPLASLLVKFALNSTRETETFGPRQ